MPATCVSGGERGGDVLFMRCAQQRGDDVHIVTFPGRNTWKESSSVAVTRLPIDRPLKRMFSKRIRKMMTYDPSAMYAIASVPVGDGPLPGGTGETVRVFRKTYPRRPIYVYNYPGNAGWWTINRVPSGEDSDWPWVPMADLPPAPTGVYLAAGTTSVDSRIDGIRRLFGRNNGHGDR